MPDPARVIVPVGVWIIIAANTLNGIVTKIDNTPTAYYFTTRPTGSAVPPETDINDAAFLGTPLFLEGRQIELTANEPTDFYALCTESIGLIEVTI